MNIYSITEIVKATNNLLKPKSESALKKYIQKNKIKLPAKTERIIREAEKEILRQKKIDQNLEKPLVLKEKPLVLKNELSVTNNDKINSFNYKIRIKPEIKDRMINELYIYLKKKIKKNTLKLIIEDEVEIRNLKNRINLLNYKESELKNDYQILRDNYGSALKNNRTLKINNEALKVENKELKINKGILQNNLDQTNQTKEQLNIENNQLKNNLNKMKLNSDQILEKNRSMEINNAELKNTISRYIVNTKKLQETHKKSENLELEEQIKKVKFYQDENIRLSGALLTAQNQSETIKDNLNHIEIEKEKISNKIKELSKSIEGKNNIISTPFTKVPSDKNKKNDNKLNDEEQKKLDEVINRIFAKK